MARRDRAELDAPAPCTPRSQTVDAMRTTPGQRGKLALRRVLNRLAAAQTVPASLAALYLRGNTDAFHTWTTVPLAPWPFANALLPAEPGARDEHVAYGCPDLTGDGSAASRWTSPKDDYDHRPRELGSLSPYVFFMWWTVEKRDAAFHTQHLAAAPGDGRHARALERLALAPTHPRARTHMARRRDKPALPQLLSDPPVRPTPGPATERQQERYAAFVLGLLASDGERAALRGDQPTASLWDQLVQWEAQCARGTDAGLVAATVQRNLADLAEVRPLVLPARLATQYRPGRCSESVDVGLRFP
jgi:hypothetical protein